MRTSKIVPKGPKAAQTPLPGDVCRGKVSVGNEVCGGYGRQRQTGVNQQQAVRQRRLVVYGLLFEVGLGVVADGADFGGLGTDVQVAAVAALPDLDALAREDLALLHAPSHHIRRAVPLPQVAGLQGALCA